MKNGTIAQEWRNGETCYLAVAVDEAAPQGRVEYIGSSPLVDPKTGEALTNQQLRKACVADIKAQRDAQIVTPTVTATSGTVQL